MEWCQRYAFHNRRFMLDLVAAAVEKVTKRTPDTSRVVNIHHNYCQCERCSWKVGTFSAQLRLLCEQACIGITLHLRNTADSIKVEHQDELAIQEEDGMTFGCKSCFMIDKI